MQPPRIRIVHISDLHLGKEGKQPWRMRRVLGQAWEDNLRTIASDGPVDLLCFTGDVAQAGKAEQYAEALEFVRAALEILGLPPERFFCVPGNHDVDRSINKPEWERLRKAIGDAGRGAAEGISKWMAGGAVPFGFQPEWREAVLTRQAAYQAWLAQIDRSALLPGAGLLGWRVSVDVGQASPLHLIGLDSAWLAGDDHDATKLLLTADQIGRLCTDEHGARLSGPLIALMHHPFDELADGREGRRLLAEHGVSLILHGHLHEPEHARWDTPSQGLHLSAAGCLYEGTKFPNSLQVLDLTLAPAHTLQPQQLWARAWSARGHWHDDDSLYPGSKNGRLQLSAPLAPTMPLASDTFVGRESQLKALKAALLPAHAHDTQAVVVCCAIEGMAGVGKTRLAEEFVTQHWLPHWGLPLDDGLAQHVVRLALSNEGRPPNTQDLAQTVADRLRLAGPLETVFERVAQGLRHGPQGKPRLLWLDNVDTQALAHAVAPLRHHLKGCPLLVTARFQRLGSKEWQRVPVKPMEDEEALRMLQSQLDEQAALRIKPADALALVRRLGGLPLALHIAASHLNLGHTPQSFIQALESHGLGLAPANADDPALLADHARAIIRHSFALSWQHWCAHQAPEWQHALVALAHGPAADVGASLAAAITGLADGAWQQLAPAAQRLSLLQVDTITQRISLHPLIAEFMRSQPGADSALVQERMGAWFMPRLPETGDAAQGQAWSAVRAEPQALAHWLDRLPTEQALAVERTAKDLAVLQGPFGTWREFLERLLADTEEPEHHSNLLWTLCQVTHHAGDPAAALDYADKKARLDNLHGKAREEALALGARADILEARGQLDEALRIRQEEQLPVYQQLGDVRSLAVTKGQIADILQARGQLDEALRIRQEEQLPVYQQLGDVRETLVCQVNIALNLAQRGHRDDGPEIARLLQAAHAAAQRLGLPEAAEIERLFQKIFGRPLVSAA